MTLSGLPRWRTPCVSLTQSQMVNLLNWYQIGPISKSRKKMDKKMQMNSFGQFLSLCCFVRHSCMCSKREKMKHSPSEEKLFLGLFRQSPKRTKKIHPKSKWTFFAGLLGCSTWQQVSASGTEEKRREMRKKTKIPSLHLVNCPKKVWKKFTQNTKSICPSLFPLIYTRPWTKKQHSKFELICWENRAWAHGGGRRGCTIGLSPSPWPKGA